MAYTLTVEYNDEVGHFITLPNALLDEVGWKEGDELSWIDNGDGSWTLKKKEKMNLVLVETVSTFRQRYVLEVPEDGDPEWVLDTVVMNEANEFSQKHLDETIVSHRIVNRDEVLRLCDQDNDYASKWSDEKKFEAFVTPWKE